MRSYSLKLLVVLLIAAFVLAACGSSDSDDGDNDTSSNNNSGAETTFVERDLDAPAALDADFRDDPAAWVGATGRPQLLEFYTTWCPTCKQIKPEVHQLEADYWNKIDVVYLDRES